MNRFVSRVVTTAALFFSSQLFAFANPPVEEGAPLCYAYAMVGYDSVINSRLGVPAEYALGLAIENPGTITAQANYSTYVLRVALDAYLWQGSPDDYAVQVFYRCAQDQG
jgi:hypothetical protein